MRQVDYVLAQVSIGRLLGPLDSPALAGYVYGDAHLAVLRRREHFPPPDRPVAVIR